ncbi:MAG: hypothetical protein LBP71_07050 [Spirochaetaceae bacterium]|jgi:hypothetical protein|nr:hypothetical protein [Spirochaetaceae bacterium]
MSNDVFSLPEAEFLTFANQCKYGLDTHGALLGVPDTLRTDFNTKLTAYTAAYHTAEASNAGKIARENRREKREALKTVIRKIKNAYIDPDPLDLVTDQIRLDFGLPLRDTTPTDVPDPAEVVPFTLESGEYLQVIVKHPARPVRYKVGAPPPANHDELTKSKLLTRPREILSFEDTQLGQTLYIALYWQNEKGRLGPPSPIQSHMIA